MFIGGIRFEQHYHSSCVRSQNTERPVGLFVRTFISRYFAYMICMLQPWVLTLGKRILCSCPDQFRWSRMGVRSILRRTVALAWLRTPGFYSLGELYSAIRAHRGILWRVRQPETMQRCPAEKRCTREPSGCSGTATLLRVLAEQRCNGDGSRTRPYSRRMRETRRSCFLEKRNIL